MKFKTYIIILTVPAILWMLWAGTRMAVLHFTGKSFKNPHAIQWKTARGGLHSEVFKKEIDQEKEAYLVRIVRNDTKEPIYEKLLYIDWDLGGGGFIKAVQADNDPELEILYLTKTPEPDFFLDVTDSGVIERPFEEASEELRKQAGLYLRFYAPNPFTVGLALFVTMLYYVVGFPGLLIFDMIKRRKRH